MRRRNSRTSRSGDHGAPILETSRTFRYVTRRLDPGKAPIEIVWVLVTAPEGLVEAVL